jgi:hypothetical protein
VLPPARPKAARTRQSRDPQRSRRVTA